MSGPNSESRARKSIAATRRWALSSPEERQSQTRRAREAFYGKFLAQVDDAVPGLSDPERHRRANALMRAHFSELRLRKRNDPPMPLSPEGTVRQSPIGKQHGASNDGSSHTMESSGRAAGADMTGPTTRVEVGRAEPPLERGEARSMSAEANCHGGDDR
jgi:hypothetical protein